MSFVAILLLVIIVIMLGGRTFIFGLIMAGVIFIVVALLALMTV